MNFPYIKFTLVLLAILFVPIIPSDEIRNCDKDGVCEDSVGYISLYTKYTTK